MAGAAIEVGVEDAVGVVEAGMELESTKADLLEDIRVWKVVLVTGVIVACDVRVAEAVEAVEVRVDVLDVLLGTTVRAVLVGKTALFCPRQTLYADAAKSMLPHDAYTQPSATSPRDSPMVL